MTLSSFRDAGAVLTAQPVTIRFEHEGRRRRYTPDFRVAWSDGVIDIVEIKYRIDLRANWYHLRPAFAAARAWAGAQGARFRVVTERGIRGSALDAAKRLLPLRSAPVDATLGRWIAGARAHQSRKAVMAQALTMVGVSLNTDEAYAVLRVHRRAGRGRRRRLWKPNPLRRTILAEPTHDSARSS